MLRNGGFLIDALAGMWQSVESITSLSGTRQRVLKDEIARNNVVGVDIARDPALARIARINMYLHGDGGSSIYQLDALDKSLPVNDEDSADIAAEKREFMTRLADGGFADKVLTNPPFAKEYKRARPGGQPTIEDRVLDEYDLGTDQSGTTAKPVKTLRSSVMFLERYHDLLRPGGRIVTVIDDSVLGNDTYRQVRTWLRERYIIEAVVSLPGDAFQRSQARVKTSLLVMRKRTDPDEDQPDVFMMYATNVGVDDPPRERILPGDAAVRAAALAEIDNIGVLFEEFQTYGSSPRTKPWILPASSIADRMDVKSCLLEVGVQVPTWEQAGLDVVQVSDLVAPRYGEGDTDDVIDVSEIEEVMAGLVTYLRVRYEGFAESGDEIDPGDTNYPKLYRVCAGDLVISHINAIHGAVAVVPSELDGHVVTNEYTVVRAITDLDIRVVWALLRTPVVRADMLSGSTGIGRTRVRWEDIEGLKIPRPTDALASAVIAQLDAADVARRSAEAQLFAAVDQIRRGLQLTSQNALDVIAAFKPPR